MTGFEDLKVYQLSEKLANELWGIVSGWDDFVKNSLGQQIVNSADSIGANLAQGNGRYNLRDNRRFVRIARGSLNETRHWLRLAYKRNLFTQKEIDILKPIVDELSPRLNAYLNYFNDRIDKPIEKAASTKVDRTSEVNDSIMELLERASLQREIKKGE
jgi:four helix bundle protein